MWSLPGHASRSEFVGCLQTVEHCGILLIQNCLHSRRIQFKIHWGRLRPLPQCERKLGYKYLGPDGARATAVGLR